MAGGIGSRFWPYSKQAKPKQFLDILGTGKTLLQMTYDRFSDICPPENVWIVTNSDYAELCQEQLPAIAPGRILVEPLRKNTAPALAYAAYRIAAEDADALMIAAPSDHVILGDQAFTSDIDRTLACAASGDWLVTLGIPPTRPDTGYGYIQYLKETVNSYGISKVKTFTEKPTLDIAKMFLASGDFLWNSGMFVWSVKSFMQAMTLHAGELAELFEAGKDVYGTPEEQAFIAKTYEQATNVSIDYALMEKADNVWVAPAEFNWSDLGTWGSLWEIHEKDYFGNAVSGDQVMTYDSQNCMVKMPDGKLAVIQGLDGYIVVESDGVLLICKKENEQEIKGMVADVKKQLGEKYL